jgi:hypothetical protein
MHGDFQQLQALGLFHVSILPMVFSQSMAIGFKTGLTQAGGRCLGLARRGFGTLVALREVARDLDRLSLRERYMGGN